MGGRGGEDERKGGVVCGKKYSVTSLPNTTPLPLPPPPLSFHTGGSLDQSFSCDIQNEDFF